LNQAVTHNYGGFDVNMWWISWFDI